MVIKLTNFVIGEYVKINKDASTFAPLAIPSSDYNIEFTITEELPDVCGKKVVEIKNSSETHRIYLNDLIEVPKKTIDPNKKILTITVDSGYCLNTLLEYLPETVDLLAKSISPTKIELISELNIEEYNAISELLNIYDLNI